MRCLFVLIYILFLPYFGFSQSSEPYKSGESLTYILNYKWGAVNTDVGEAVTDLSYNNGMFHSVIKGKTYKFYDVFFPVREHFESKFYANPIKPYYFFRNTSEGKYRIKNHFYFDTINNVIKATIQHYDKSPIDTTLKIFNNTFDLVSLFYKVRNIDFHNLPRGVRHPISFAIDDDVYNFYYIYLGTEIKKIPKIGTFRTLKFVVKLVAGSVFTGEEEMTIWVSDDNNKIPLFFESPILVGIVQGRLSKWSNIKYPMSSKIK